MASLKTEVDILDIDKLTPVPYYLAKLSNVVKHDLVKKTEYNKLVTEVDNIDTTNFVKKTKYEKDGSDFEDKINKIDRKYLMLMVWLKKTDFNTKVTEVECQIPSISSLATNSALTVVENKIPDVSSLVKKTDFNTTVTEKEGKIPDVSSLVKKTDYTTEISSIKNDYVTNAALNTRHKDLIQKTKFDTEVKKINDKIASNISEVLTYNNRLSQAKDRIDELERIASYFRGKNNFDGNGGTQNALVFQVKSKYFVRFNNLVAIYDIWESNGLSDQRLSIAKGSVRTSKLIRPGYVIFSKGADFLQQDKSNVIAAKSIVNIYIVCKLFAKSISSSNALKNCLIGATEVKKTNKTADPPKWQYSGHGLAFDRTVQFTHNDGSLARNITICGADLSTSRHSTNKTQNNLLLGHAFIQKINDTIIYAERSYSPNFSIDNKVFCLSLRYNGDNSYLFVNGKDVATFKAKNSEIKPQPIALGSITTTEHLSTDEIKKSKLYGNIYDFMLISCLYYMIFMLIC